MDYLKLLLNYLISFSVGLFLITYVLRAPYVITGKNKIVDEYYLKNFKTNVPLDAFFIICYFLVSEFVSYQLKIKKSFNKLIVVGIVTALITGGFCYYFLNNPQKNNFFSRWFNTVGYRSVIYDVVLLMFIYYIMIYLDKMIE